MTQNSVSKFFSVVAYRLHPRIGRFYEAHADFLNDGFVELVCLLIASGFVVWFSFYFVGFTLALVLTLVSTPITFGLKYLLHKYWVWKK